MANGRLPGWIPAWVIAIINVLHPDKEAVPGFCCKFCECSWTLDEWTEAEIDELVMHHMRNYHPEQVENQEES